jgi:hypothetical protein
LYSHVGEDVYHFEHQVFNKGMGNYSSHDKKYNNTFLVLLY